MCGLLKQKNFQCSCPEHFFLLWSHMGGGDWGLLPSKSAVMSSLDVHVNNSWKVNVFVKRSSFRKMFVQSGTFPNPSMGSKSSGCAQMNSLWRDGAGGKTQMREMRIGMVGDSVLCWGEWWEIKCSTIVCLDMCFIRYVSWKKQQQHKAQHFSPGQWEQSLNLQVHTHNSLHPCYCSIKSYISKEL